MCRAFVTMVIVVGLSSAASAIDVETVSIGNPGNANDTHGAGYGAVDYAYEIGRYEVTAGQYTAFLNALAARDTYGLYNAEMWTDTYGCKIERHGSWGSYTYSVAPNYASRPATFVSWADSLRFGNWLHNGQPTGTQDANTTEDGAYDLSATQQYYGPNGETPEGQDYVALDAALLAISREADWEWAVTNQDEWYKAAYHKNDGVTGNYFDYPTSSNTISIDMANYADSVGHTTDVGSYSDYPSPYGTFDQGGNVWEWNEAMILSFARGTRGASFRTTDGETGLHAQYVGCEYQLPERYDIGFRVVAVPEPASLALLALGGLATIRRKQGR